MSSLPEKKEESASFARFLSFLRTRRRREQQRIEAEQPPPKPKANPRYSKEGIWRAMRYRERHMANSHAARQLYLDDDLREFCTKIGLFNAPMEASDSEAVEEAEQSIQDDPFFADTAEGNDVPENSSHQRALTSSESNTADDQVTFEDLQTQCQDADELPQDMPTLPLSRRAHSPSGTTPKFDFSWENSELLDWFLYHFPNQPEPSRK